MKFWLLIALLGLASCAGKENMRFNAIDNRKAAVQDIVRARDSHVYWAKRIEEGKSVEIKRSGTILTIDEAVELVGSVEHNMRWVERYDRVLKELGYVEQKVER